LKLHKAESGNKYLLQNTVWIVSAKNLIVSNESSDRGSADVRREIVRLEGDLEKQCVEKSLKYIEAACEISRNLAIDLYPDLLGTDGMVAG
jgi:hypothetical protein